MSTLIAPLRRGLEGSNPKVGLAPSHALQGSRFIPALFLPPQCVSNGAPHWDKTAAPAPHITARVTRRVAVRVNSPSRCLPAFPWLGLCHNTPCPVTGQGALADHAWPGYDYPPRRVHTAGFWSGDIHSVCHNRRSVFFSLWKFRIIDSPWCFGRK